MVRLILKLKILLSFFSIFFISNQLNSEDLSLLPMGPQVGDGVVWGKVRGMVPRKIKGKKQITEYFIQLNGVQGISPRQVVNRNHFRVYWDDGTPEDVDDLYHVDPQLAQGAEVVIIVKKDIHGLRIMEGNFGIFILGKNEKGLFLTPYFNTSNSNYLKINFSDFQDKVQEVFGSPLVSYWGTNKYQRVLKKNFADGRSPASIKEEAEEDDKSDVGVIWLVLIFALLGIFHEVILNREEN